MTALWLQSSAAYGQLPTIGDLLNSINVLNAQVAVHTSEILAINVDLNVLDLQTTTNTTAVAQLNYDFGVVTTQVTANGAIVTALDGRVGTIEGMLPPIVGRTAALEASVTGQAAAIALNTAGIAANASAATVNAAAIAANALRDDGQDVLIAANASATATNTGAIAALDGRVTAHDGILAQHTVGIAVATQTATAAQTATATLRNDVAAGRVGLVQQDATGLITVGAQTGGSEVSLAGTTGNRRLSGVANGVGPSDAATVGQVTQSQAQAVGLANAYTDQSMANFVARFDDHTQSLIAQNNTVLRREMNAAAATTAAISSLPHSINPGEGMGSIGIGGRGDAVAFAIGMSKAFKVDHTPVVRAGAALDARTGTLTYNASVGVHF